MISRAARSHCARGEMPHKSGEGAKGESGIARYNASERISRGEAYRPGKVALKNAIGKPSDSPVVTDRKSVGPNGGRGGR